MADYSLSPPSVWHSLYTRTFPHTNDLCLETEAASRAPAPSPSPATPVASSPPPPPPDALSSCLASALSSADSALCLVTELDAHHRSLASRTTQLHEECKRLVEEEGRLRGVVHSIYHPLSYFDSLLVLGRRLGLPGELGEVTDALSVLREVQRLGSGPGGSGSAGPAAAAAAASPSRTPASAAAAAAAAAPPSLTSAAAFNPHRVSLTDAQLTPEDPEFASALERIDECVAYLAANGSRFRDATLYIARFSALRLRALGLVAAAVRDSVEAVAAAVERELGTARAQHAAAAAALAQALQQQRLLQSSNAAAAAAAAAAGGPSPAAAAAALASAQSNLDAVELYQLQLRFRGDLSHLRGLIALVEARGAKRAYGEVLQECFSAYATRRASLVIPLLRERLSRVIKDKLKSMHAGSSSAGSAAATAAAATAAAATAASAASLSPSPTKGDAVDREGDDSLAHHPQAQHSRPATVITARTHTTMGRASVALWASDTSARESVVLDALRNAASLVSRAVQAEHTLFHAIFLGGRGGSASASASAAAAAASERSAISAAQAELERELEAVAGGGSSSASVASGRTWRGGAGSVTHAQVAAQAQAQAQAAAQGSSAVTGYVRAAADAVLSQLCEEVAGVLGDVFRPVLLSVVSLEVLFDCAHVIRDEVLGELCGVTRIAPVGGPGAGIGAASASASASALAASFSGTSSSISTLSAPRTAAAAPFARATASLLQDLCDRLCFRAQGFITERIDGYRLQPAGSVTAAFPLNTALLGANGTPLLLASIRIHGDADPLARLLAYYYRVRAAAGEGGSAAAAAASAASVAGSGAPSSWDSWFPLLELTLVLLSKLYRTLERGAFEALAQDAVSACTRQLVAAGEAIRSGAGAPLPTAIDSYAVSRTSIVVASGGGSAAGEAGACAPALAAGALALPPGTLSRDLFAGALLLCPPSQQPQPPQQPGAPLPPSALAAAAALTSELDGLCFTIKNLLVLREQLSPFAVSLTATTQTLDFSSTSTALATLLSVSAWSAGPSAALSLSSRTNPLLEFLTTGMPRVAEQRVNFKSHLEELLRRTCDTLITRVHSLCVGGVAALLAASAQAAAAAAASSTSAAPPSASLAAQPAFVASVQAAVERSRADMEALLPLIRRRLGLYLGSPMTAAILFSPIRDRVLYTYAALRQCVYEALEGGGQRLALEAAINVALGVLEASDVVIVDPHNLGYGHDTAVFTAKVAEKAAAAGAAAAAAAAGEAEAEAAGGGGGQGESTPAAI